MRVNDRQCSIIGSLVEWCANDAERASAEGRAPQFGYVDLYVTAPTGALVDQRRAMLPMQAVADSTAPKPGTAVVVIRVHEVEP